MTAVEIHNTTEAQQRLCDALNILDAISAYSINHRVPSEQLFNIHVRKRLQSLYVKLPPPIYPLLEESDELSKDEKKTLSPYCYKIEDSANDFDDVFRGLEAHYKQMNAQNLASKGELIDTIIRGGVSKIIRSVVGILDVIGSLALWHIREEEARTLASTRGHRLVSQEDKSNAATEMWQHLSAYNSNADRKELDARITAGIRWNRFLCGREIGMIVTVHKLPPSLKFRAKLITKLAFIVTDMPGMLDQAKKATPCIQKLLDSRLGPWTGSKKRRLSLEHRGPDAGAESVIPGATPIGVLLNAAEQIAAATQGEALEQHRKRRRIDPLPLSTKDRGSIVTAEDLAGDNAQAQNISIFDLSVLQPPGAPISDHSKVAGPKAQGSRATVMMAEVEKLESRLGGYLFEGLNATRMRHRENHRRVTRFTDTVRLHVAHREGEDFKLEVWVGLPIGRAIVQAKTKSVHDLESLLGGYLFEAMKTSNWRKEEETTKISDCTGAVNVSLPYLDDDSDCKVEVMLNFEAGQFMWAELFPR